MKEQNDKEVTVRAYGIGEHGEDRNTDIWVRLPQQTMETYVVSYMYLVTEGFSPLYPHPRTDTVTLWQGADQRAVVLRLKEILVESLGTDKVAILNFWPVDAESVAVDVAGREGTDAAGE